MVDERTKARFFKHVVKQSGSDCWLWISAKNRLGFGIFYLTSLKVVQAHRYIFEIMGTPIDPTMDVLHLCENRACLNPEHLEIQTTETRFMKFVNIDPKIGCWNWTGNMKGGHLWKRYGSFVIMGKSYLAHRVSYEMYRGELSDDEMVLHTCNNSFCVNPEHLYKGDHVRNMNDMTVANRQARGEDNANSILTYDQVVEIKKLLRSNLYTHKEIADMFGVARPTITDIKKGKTWAWVD